MTGRQLTQTPAQTAIMAWTAGLGAVTASALAIREDTSLAVARARLAALVGAGWLVSERPLTGQPSLYTATKSGLRAAGLSARRPSRVSVSGAMHLIECARVAAVLERRYPACSVLGEQTLRREEHERETPLASAWLRARAGGRPLLHRPDLVLLPIVCAEPGERLIGAELGVVDERPVAVEVELTVKAPRRLAEICLAWARCRWVSGVLYLAPPDVQRALARAIERSAAHERIVVVGLDALG